MTPREDAGLLREAASGSEEAFTTILLANQDRVFAVTMRILGDRERALDATQETFLTVFRKADQFQGRSAVSTWIHRIAVNVCYDILRKERRRKTQQLPSYLDPSDPAAESAIESAAMRPEIARALRSIPPDFRIPVVLCDMEGMSLHDAAETLGVPVGTIKSRLFRARRLLAEILGNQNAATNIEDSDA